MRSWLAFSREMCVFVSAFVYELWHFFSDNIYLEDSCANHFFFVFMLLIIPTESVLCVHVCESLDLNGFGSLNGERYRGNGLLLDGNERNLR